MTPTQDSIIGLLCVVIFGNALLRLHFIWLSNPDLTKVIFIVFELGRPMSALESKIKLHVFILYFKAVEQTDWFVTS